MLTKSCQITQGSTAVQTDAQGTDAHDGGLHTAILVNSELWFFCQLSVGLVPLVLQTEGNCPKGITAALMAPVDLAVISLGAPS